jgi:hypothetical protein
LILLLVLIVLGSAAGFIRWKRLQVGHYFWQPKPVAEAPAAPATPQDTTPAAPAVP